MISITKLTTNQNNTQQKIIEITNVPKQKRIITGILCKNINNKFSKNKKRSSSWHNTQRIKIKGETILLYYEYYLNKNVQKQKRKALQIYYANKTEKEHKME